MATLNIDPKFEAQLPGTVAFLKQLDESLAEVSLLRDAEGDLAVQRDEEIDFLITEMRELQLEREREERAAHEHRQVGLRDLLDGLEDALHLRTGAHEGPEAVQRRQLTITMTNKLFLAQFKRWISDLHDLDKQKPKLGAKLFCVAVES